MNNHTQVLYFQKWDYLWNNFQNSFILPLKRCKILKIEKSFNSLFALSYFEMNMDKVFYIFLMAKNIGKMCMKRMCYKQFIGENA